MKMWTGVRNEHDSSDHHLHQIAEVAKHYFQTFYVLMFPPVSFNAIAFTKQYFFPYPSTSLFLFADLLVANNQAELQ